MDNFKLKLLAALEKHSNPYVDIRELDGEFDRNSEQFIEAFQELEENSLIASKNTLDCGLEVGADGLAQWSVVDLYVTDYGRDVLAG